MQASKTESNVSQQHNCLICVDVPHASRSLELEAVTLLSLAQSEASADLTFLNVAIIVVTSKKRQVTARRQATQTSARTETEHARAQHG